MKQAPQDLEKRLAAIEVRNQRVELDKAWETSRARRLSIVILTYLVVASYLWFMDIGMWWRDAAVPVIGFYISSLTLSIIKRYWQQQH